MSDKKWKIEFEPGSWESIRDGVKSSGDGMYKITFDGSRYGVISKEAWDNTPTGEILTFVEQMLNDAYSLALREHD